MASGVAPGETTSLCLIPERAVQAACQSGTSKCHCQTSLGLESGVPFSTNSIGFFDGRARVTNVASRNVFPVGEPMKRIGQWTTLFVVFLALSGAGFSQASSSSLRGTVTDPAGNALPDATVVAANPDLKITRTATTGGLGDYSFQALPPGTYTLTVSATGFTRYQQTGIQLLVNTPATANVQLKVGG